MSAEYVSEVPVIHNTVELELLYLKPLYILSDYMVNYETYEEFHETIYNIVKGCFTIRACREYPVRFKFNAHEKEIHTIELRHFIVVIKLWNPFVELNDLEVLDESYVPDYETDIPAINDYINEKLIGTLREYHIKSTTVNYSISETLHKLRQISEDFSIILGLNFSIPMFIDLYNNHPVLRDMMESKFSLNMQPHEVETQLHEMEDKEINYLMSLKDNHLGIVLRARTGMKHKQLVEYTISEGLKPDLDGNTIPITIENSTLIRGLDRPSYLYLDALAARKSLITNKKVMGKAGYFGKILLLLARTLQLSTTVSDCGSECYVTYDVRDKGFLKKLNGKFYKVDRSDDLKLLNAKKDKDLIGKKILVRSAATCKLGDCVCAKCVGYTANNNFDIADGFAAFESEEVSKVVNQSILSTKHLLTTNSEVIRFNPEFYKFFALNAGEIFPRIDGNEDVSDIDNYAIYIDPNDVTKLEEMDADSQYNTVIYNGRFYVRNLKKPSEPDICMQAENENEIFLSADALELWKGKNLIKFKDIDDDFKLFEMVILNNELTKPLYDIMNLLNKEKKEEIDETIDSVCQKFVELLCDSKIAANAIAAELIINRLIKSANNIYERPSFNGKEPSPYIIVTVTKALEKNRSPLIGISFQNIKRQFLSDELYTERDGSSYIDALYMENIPTDNLKKYARMASEKYRNYAAKIR